MGILKNVNFGYILLLILNLTLGWTFIVVITYYKYKDKINEFLESDEYDNNDFNNDLIASQITTVFGIFINYLVFPKACFLAMVLLFLVYTIFSQYDDEELKTIMLESFKKNLKEKE